MIDSSGWTGATSDVYNDNLWGGLVNSEGSADPPPPVLPPKKPLVYAYVPPPQSVYNTMNPTYSEHPPFVSGPEINYYGGERHVLFPSPWDRLKWLAGKMPKRSEPDMRGLKSF
jgi:hypothetical protein